MQQAFSHGARRHYNYNSPKYRTFSKDCRNPFDYTNLKTPYRESIELDQGCELAVKIKDSETYFIVMNYLHSPVNINVHKTMIDMDSNTEVIGSVVLEAFETKVYKKCNYPFNY